MTKARHPAPRLNSPSRGNCQFPPRTPLEISIRLILIVALTAAAISITNWCIA